MLGIDTTFKGDIRFKGTLRIDGSVQGTIISDEGSGSVLVINQQAFVEGNIISDTVLISGKVSGNIKAVERVEIFRSGSLKGDIYTNDVMIEGGADFEGHCRMLTYMDAEKRGKILLDPTQKRGTHGNKSHTPDPNDEIGDQTGTASV